MPPVNWNTFSQLPGAAESNFEILCRALIRCQYGPYEDFRALAQQPKERRAHALLEFDDQWLGEEILAGMSLPRPLRATVDQQVGLLLGSVVGTGW